MLTAHFVVVQAYYGAGAAPPPFFASSVASPAPHPYMWGAQVSSFTCSIVEKCSHFITVTHEEGGL